MQSDISELTQWDYQNKLALSRIKNVASIFNICSKLELEVTTAAIAISFLHRYIDFMEKDGSNCDEDTEVLMSSCIFLAAKVKEQSRSMRDIINIVKAYKGENTEHMVFDSVSVHL